jgi:hypothetical protein
MTKIYFSDPTKAFTRRVFEALLTVADQDKGDRDKNIKLKCEWSSTRQIKFEIGKADLKKLVGNATEKQFTNEIQPALVGYLSVILGILTEISDPTGSGLREFSLDLWDEDKDKNLARFDEEWDKKANEHKKSNPKSSKSSRTATPTTPQIDWLDRSRQLLAAQKHLTTNNLLPLNTKNFDDLHVPLGLIERKERPKVKEEPSPEHGSQLDRVEYTETKRYEHDDFLAEVVGKPAGGKHIAIIGEPGAGKTTILMNIGEWLITAAAKQPEEPLLVAWISLAGLKDRELSDHFYGKWLKDAHPAANPPPSWKDELAKLVEQRRVWLLLDGLDEVSNFSTPNWLNEQLRGWGQNLRVVITCRINQWETTGNSLVNSFEVYRTLDYSYQTSKGDNQVQQFISKWFANDEHVANQILTELDAPGKERIKDLVKNPLRLTLLCASWEKDTHALAETQADLYRGFVNYLYDWKAVEFPNEVKLREELNLVLGELAKAGLNRVPINDGAVRRFRFTASEISKLWKDRSDTLLAAAKNLGWLNVVGKEYGADLYAFYHPTFQEYFAACSIDDWDYFLPREHEDRPVNCDGEDKPTYRVFEQEWRQVILLWTGRRDEVITDELKEQFIDKLTDFREQEEKFYYYRAYYMAAICVGEFRSSRQAESITQQTINWAFCYFREDLTWVNFLAPISSSVKEIISFVHREHVVNRIFSILSCQDLSGKDRDDVFEILSRIAKNDRKVIDTVLFLCEQEYSEYTRNSIGDILCKIAIGDRKTIDILILYHEQKRFISISFFDTLSKIAIGDQKAIDVVVSFVEREDLSVGQYENALECLDKITNSGNRKVINILLVIIERGNLWQKYNRSIDVIY